MLCIFLQTINNEEDQKAFEELYKKYSKNLLTYAIGKLGRSGNFQDAEDAVSQTFCRIIMALPPPKGDEVDSKEIKNYLYATLAGICLDKFEKKNKEKSVMFLTDEIQKFRQSLDELADSVIDKLTLDEVIEVIEKLPYKLKTPFMLHFVHGLTCRQIGLLMNIKEQTVRQRICRIRKIIAEALKGVIFDD